MSEQQNVDKAGLTDAQRHAIARLIPGSQAEVVPTGVIYDWTCQAVFAEVAKIIATVDRQPRHGDDGVPVVRVREHDGSGLTVTVAAIPGLGLGTRITRLLDEHWPNSRVNGHYLADLLRSEASSLSSANQTEEDR